MRSWLVESTNTAMSGCATAKIDLFDRDGMEDWK